MTKTIDTEQLKQATDLRELAARYTELRKESARELAGPCPKCGGTRRFHCQADWFFCRDCHPKRGDVIAFTMWLDNCTFKEAVATLTNATPTTTAAPRRPQAHHAIEPSPDWQRDANERAERAHWRLNDDDDQGATAARSYLIGRGLVPQTWQAFRLGYWHAVAVPGTEGKRRAPALVMPWYKAGQVVAVRYRFLERQGDTKQTALLGSVFAGQLYGDQALACNVPQLSTLVICEGELNACSIWQAAHDTHLDVLSLGSESATITPAMQERAGRYATVIVWFDKEAVAQAAMRALPGAYGIKSPGSRDANDLLCTGQLSAFLAAHRHRAAKDDYQRRRLLYDLADAKTDELTKELIGRIVQQR